MEKISKWIEDIVEQAMDSLLQCEDFDYEYDEGYLHDASARAGIDIGDLHINLYYYYNGKIEEFECEARSKKTERFFDNIERGIEKHLNDFDHLVYVRNAIDEYARDSVYDEWNDHGFRDAQDYYRWRYG